MLRPMEGACYSSLMNDDTATVATTRFVLVADGHTAAESTWTYGTFRTRDQAIRHCDLMNGCTPSHASSVHVERVS